MAPKKKATGDSPYNMVYGRERLPFLDKRLEGIAEKGVGEDDGLSVD